MGFSTDGITFVRREDLVKRLDEDPKDYRSINEAIEWFLIRSFPGSWVVDSSLRISEFYGDIVEEDVQVITSAAPTKTHKRVNAKPTERLETIKLVQVRSSSTILEMSTNLEKITKNETTFNFSTSFLKSTFNGGTVKSQTLTTKDFMKETLGSNDSETKTTDYELKISAFMIGVLFERKLNTTHFYPFYGDMLLEGEVEVQGGFDGLQKGRHSLVNLLPARDKRIFSGSGTIVTQISDSIDEIDIEAPISFSREIILKESWSAEDIVDLLERVTAAKIENSNEPAN